MKQSHLKLIRVGVSLLFLLCTSAVFMDLLGKLPAPLIDSILYLQFIPSLIHYIQSAAWVSSGFIIILILTMLFGRLFCSCICPLGALQDTFIRFFRHLTPYQRKFSYQQPLNLLRFGVLTITMISSITGSLLLLSLLDPFSHFGRIMSDLIRPIVVAANNILVMVFHWAGIYALYPLGYKAPAALSLLLPLFILILLLCFTAEKGRLFCNTFCPVGTLLSLLSHRSLFKISINNSICTRCGKCALQCKAGCINLKESTVDFSRCISCFNCIRSCPEAAIRYNSSFKNLDAGNHPHKQQRRAVLTSLICFFLFRPHLGNSQPPTPEAQKVPVRNRIPSTVVNEKNYPVAPPGARTINHLLSNCTACHLCISTCPTGVLQPALGKYGPNGFLRPHLDAVSGFCNFDCTRCGDICPTGAIQRLPIKRKKRTQIGKTLFIKKNCVVETDKKDCGACAEHCPTKAVRMVPFEGKLKIPELDNKYCVGCGACEHICPVRPHKAIFVDGLPVHRISEAPVSKPLTVVPMEDFPF